MAKTLDALKASIEAQQKKLAQLKEKERRLAAKQRASESKKNRADDTRRKILLGSYVLAAIESAGGYPPEVYPKFRLFNNGITLDGFLTRADDRALFELNPSNTPAVED
ncbi:MAG TPA: mobilization protein [Betaproteobacteria bacterium]|jgi:hypothetical protein|nr:mobilization protein [Betaproteobacteria bacterium]